MNADVTPRFAAVTGGFLAVDVWVDGSSGAEGLGVGDFIEVHERGLRVRGRIAAVTGPWTCRIVPEDVMTDEPELHLPYRIREDLIRD